MLVKLAKLAILSLMVPMVSTVQSFDVSSPSVVSRSGGGNLRVVEGRVVDGSELLIGPSYLLPSGKCSVQLNSTELCGEGLLAVGLEVTVTDYVTYPNVEINNLNLEEISIHRFDSCDGDINIDLKLSCLRQEVSGSHSRIPLVDNTSP